MVLLLCPTVVNRIHDKCILTHLNRVLFNRYFHIGLLYLLCLDDMRSQVLRICLMCQLEMDQRLFLCWFLLVRCVYIVWTGLYNEVSREFIIYNWECCVNVKRNSNRNGAFPIITPTGTSTITSTSLFRSEIISLCSVPVHLHRLNTFTFTFTFNA